VSEIAYRTAIRDALAEEMERDERVVLLGEDVVPGGVFNVTPELAEKFGADRVIDTPISEMAFVSAAFSAALLGLRPIVEVMFGDFLGLVLDTLANQASKYWYVSNGQSSVPLTVRSSVGAGGRFGAIHSQTPTSWFLGLSGLKLVAPATPADAKDLTKAAIRDENPVVVFEHKQLYSRKGEVPEGSEPEPIGRAAVRRRGDAVVLVAAMAAVERSLAAAEELAGLGIEAEVIDLRSLRPLDRDTIAEAAARTARLVVVEDGPPIGGYAAEVLAVVAEHAGSVNVRRVCMPDTPIPFSQVLEDAALPSVPRIVGAARALCEGVQPEVFAK
jgi:acetoin:2,6-dichlorophenolindophenol oxidoreductase subunit beta